jgi:subfamily B ATP-binding cassette protein MsbA
LKILKNESIAFVEESGSGKTTLMNIIEGLLKPAKGEVLIDGHDLKQIHTPSFQKCIGYITQEIVIFNNESFRSAKTKENVKHFWKALHQDHILEFVKEKPKKESKRLSNNDVNLGGKHNNIFLLRVNYIKN